MQQLSTTTIHDDFYGTRQVTYYTTDAGKVVIDGDIIYGTLEEFQHAEAAVGTAQAVRSLSYKRTLPWPNATILYRFHSAEDEKIAKPIVETAIARWTKAAPYLQFKPTTNGNQTMRGTIKISAIGNGGCRSTVGYYANGEMGMFLQAGGCGPDQAVHEFGHALGMCLEALPCLGDPIVLTPCLP